MSKITVLIKEYPDDLLLLVRLQSHDTIANVEHQILPTHFKTLLGKESRMCLKVGLGGKKKFFF